MLGLSQGPPRYGEENEGAGLLTVTSNDATEDMIILKSRNPQFGRNPIGSGNEYGLGQALILFDEAGGSRNNATRFRVDGYGGVGTADGVHIATGLNQTDPNYNANVTQQLWLDQGNWTGGSNALTGIVFSTKTGYAGRWIFAYYPGLATLAWAFSAANKDLELYDDTGTSAFAALYYGTTPSFGIRAAFFAGVAGTIPLYIRLAAAQTADAIQVQNSTPTSVFRVTNIGSVIAQNSATLNSVVSSPAVSSGVAFTPSANFDTMVYVQLNATVAGSFTVTMGPSTGAENTLANAVAMLINSDLVFTARVPATWKVVVTVTSVTIGQTRVVTA